MPLLVPAPSSVLAFVTTLHMAIGVLRAHRSPSTGFFSFVSVISLLLAGSPWLMPTPAGLAIGLATQISWFFACEHLLPIIGVAGPPHAASSPTAEAPRPITAPRPAAAAPKAAAAAAPRAAAKPAAVPVAAPSAVALAAPRPPLGFIQVPILAVFDETKDIRTFRMGRPEGFEFKAGQFLTVRVRADGKEHARCYSVSSSPSARGHLEISVKRLGLVSGTLHATLRPGSMMSVKAPVGAFTYPAGEDSSIVLIAGGIGITPLMSMLRHAIDEEPMRPVTLFYSVRTKEDIAYFDELRFLDRRHAQFRAVFAITEGEVPRDCFSCRINEELLKAMAPDIAHAACFVCGPPPMIEAMTTLLTSMGVPRPQVHFEVFQAAIAAVALPPSAEPVRAPESQAAAGVRATVELQLAASADGPPAEEEMEPVAAAAATIRFERSGLSATIEPGQTLLEAAEACGADIPSLCRVGVCGTCRTRVVSGKVDCPAQTLDAQDRLDGFILPCVSRIQTDCVIDA
jgi:ferredoxin-NADP reductase